MPPIEQLRVAGQTVTPGGGGEGGPVDWPDITNKPTVFPPSPHNHSYASLTETPTEFPPEAHTHAQGDVTGLTASLAGKAPTSHSHAIGDVAALQTALDGKAATSHSHAAGDITSGTLAAARLPAATTTAAGAVELATNGEAGAGVVVQGNDARLSDARTPVTHGDGAHDNTVASLVGGRVPVGELGSGTPSASNFLRGDGAWATPAGGGGGVTLQQKSLAAAFPFPGTPATLTPTAHTATVARVFPFVLEGGLTLNRVLIRTNAALANCLQVGIYDSAGVRVWASGVLSTVAAGWISVTVAALALPAGTYYLATTNNNVASTTAAYTATPALGGGAFLPRWGTVPATGGALPNSIDPTQVTETVGPFLAYVLLSEWAT